MTEEDHPTIQTSDGLLIVRVLKRTFAFLVSLLEKLEKGEKV